MFKHILVPLDGSHRAEQALPLAAYLTLQAGGKLSLLRAISLELGEGPSFYGKAGAAADEVRIALVEEAKEYLEHVSHSTTLAGIPLQTHIVSDAPAQAILLCAQAENVDLIVMGSHGYSGLTRWALGSVAQGVTRHSSIPVLIVRERDTDDVLVHPDGAHSIRALVALDGSPFAEAAIVPTAQLVSAFATAAHPGEIHLLKILKPPSDPEERRYLAFDINIRRFQIDDAESYLRTLKDELTQSLSAELHVKITCSFLEESDTATALIATAERGVSAEGQSGKGYDMIAIATHGRSGIKRWLVGSVAERVLERTRLPLLIVRPEEMTTAADR